LYLLESLPYYDRYVQGGEYTKSNVFTHHGKPFGELAGKTYGIIGMGTIGKRVAQVASAFGAEVIYYSTSGKNTAAGYTSVSLNALLERSDIISIHCPLNDTTRKLLGYEQLQRMKKNAILLNAGRGGIVDESALARSLNEGLLAGAALDVMEQEPPAADNPLLHLSQREKLLITPHIAWASQESRERLMQGIIRNITEYLQPK
jgi:phosphoglycerate dehydrogenase-like enzyme